MTTLQEILTPARQVAPRMKLFVWGASGSYKTRGVLEIARAIGGKAVVLDLERGTDRYSAEFADTYEVLPTGEPEVVKSTIQLLSQGTHDFRTLIIDPITLLWQGLIEKWEGMYLAQNAERAGHRGAWYEMNQKDWAPVKREWNQLMRLLVNLDMNVLATAREKAKYDTVMGNLKEVGRTYDGEKGLDYWFDTVLRLVEDGKGNFLAHTIKDRTGKLPAPGPAWAYKPTEVVKAFGAEDLQREVRTTIASPEILAEIRAVSTSLGLSEAELESRLREKYKAPSIDELAPDDAKRALAALKSAIPQTQEEGE